jgi:integrase
MLLILYKKTVFSECPIMSSAAPPRLLDALRERVRSMHYSLRTEEAYVYWVRAVIRFHGLRHPAALSRPDVEAFLTWLAAERRAVLTHDEVASVLAAVEPAHRLFAELLYGTGMRLMEGLRATVRPVREPARCYTLSRRFPSTPSFTAAATTAS